MGNRVSLHCRGVLEPGTSRGCLSEGPSKLSSSSEQGDSFIVNGSRPASTPSPRPPVPRESLTHTQLCARACPAAGFDSGGQQAPYSRPIADPQNWLGSWRQAEHQRCHHSSQQTPRTGSSPLPLTKALRTSVPRLLPQVGLGPHLQTHSWLSLDRQPDILDAKHAGFLFTF